MAGEPVRRRLRSGLRVLAWPLAGTHSAALCVHVRSGARYDPEGLGGLSHFLEHMLYRGTQRHPSAYEQAHAFERLGAELGASTYADHVVLSATTPPENLSAVIALLGEVCRAPLFDAVDLERGIVREEILETLGARRQSIDADDLVLGLAFGEHPLGRPILGTLQALGRFDVRALRRFHRAQYRTGGMVVSLAGALNAERTLAAVKTAFQGLPAGGPPKSTAPPPLDGPHFRYVRDAGSQTALRLAFRAPAERQRLEPATELLLRVLDDGMSTRLYRRVCDERGLAYDVSASYDAFADAGLFAMGGDCAHARSPLLCAEILDVLRELRDVGPSEIELDEARQRVTWQMRALLDHPLGLAEFLGLGELTGVARTPAARVRELARVDRRAVREAARTLFVPERLAAVAVGDLGRRQHDALARSIRNFD